MQMAKRIEAYGRASLNILKSRWPTLLLFISGFATPAILWLLADGEFGRLVSASVFGAALLATTWVLSRRLVVEGSQNVFTAVRHLQDFNEQKRFAETLDSIPSLVLIRYLIDKDELGAELNEILLDRLDTTSLRRKLIEIAGATTPEDLTGFNLFDVGADGKSAVASERVAHGLDDLFRKLGPPPEGSLNDSKTPMRDSGGGRR